MEQSRKELLSIYYWVRDLFPDFVNVTREYPEGELVLPTIAVVTLPVKTVPLQLGSDDQLDISEWAIYVFAQNVGQRDDYISIIHRSAKHSICVYDYDQGFPPNVSPTEIGSLYVRDRSKKPVRVFEDLVKKKYWLGVVLLATYFNPS